MKHDLAIRGRGFNPAVPSIQLNTFVLHREILIEYYNIKHIITI